MPVSIAGTDGIDHVEVVATAGADPIRRSATTLVQGELNSREGALWGVATNGLTWRILRDNESITRPGYIEIDLARIFRDDLYSDFSAFWLIAHHSRFPRAGTAGSDCVLERWRQLGREQGVTARDDLRNGVQKALFHFGRGFLENPANAALIARVNAEGDGRLTNENFFRQLLRLVYRLILVMTAEDREILHPEGADESARSAYTNGYATGRLRERSRNRIAWDRHHDAYEGMKIIFRALGHGETKLALPALGGLFGADQTRDLDAARLTNKRFLNGLYHLAWLRRDDALARINWRDMETEEFGSVYESLLELTPAITDSGRLFSFVGEADEDAADDGTTKAGNKAKATKGNERKTTGSYYTPDSLVQLLLKQALDPVIDRKVAETPNDPEVLLALKVIDPACGSGHFLLAAARKIARRLAEARHAGSPTIAQYRHALREAARYCIHGVDRNPTAVELTKVALWIETIEPGRPLGFLDANIRCGDSLLGVFDLEALRQGIPDDAYRPLTGDDKETAKHFAARNRAEKTGQGTLDFGGRSHSLPAVPPLAEASRALRALPEDSVEQIAEKQRRVRAAEADPGRWRWRVAADLYVAAFLTPKTGGVPVNRNTATIPTTEHVWAELAGSTVFGSLIVRAQDLAGKARAFHWPLEFPDAFAEVGFDAVLGNPPWERIKLQEQEFFASRDEAIATAPNVTTRGRLIAALSSAPSGSRERDLYEEFETAKRLAEAASCFARVSGDDGGRFPLTGRGDVNTYALFAELFSRLTGPKARAGVIVPTGIATDATTAPFFAALVNEKRLAGLIDFENRDAIFPAVHRSYKFCLLTMGHHVEKAQFSFFLTDPKEVEETERTFVLTPEEIGAINPNTKTAPIFRSKLDANLGTKLHLHFKSIVNEFSGIDFYRCIDVNKDSKFINRFRSIDDVDYVPLYEGKMIFFYDHRAAGYSSRGNDRGYRVLPEATAEEHKDINFEQTFYYEVERRQVENRLPSTWSKQWLVAYKDVSASTNERSMIASIIPRWGSDYSVRLAFPLGDAKNAAALIAIFRGLSR